jgi:membrane fusion protein (multidrug efflux system)
MKPLFIFAVSAWAAAAVPLAAAAEVQGVVLPGKQVSLSSPVYQEVINAILVEEGDTVKEGQPLVQLRAEREELEVARTQKLIELATFKSKGAESLFKEKMGSREKALEEQAQLELSQILHRAAELSVRERTVRSPLSGIVVKRYKEAGESVEKVEKLLDIVNIDRVYVQFYLDPKLMETVKMEQPVKIKIPVPLGGQEFTSSVSFIDPRIDAGSGLFRIKVQIENADHKIKAGMRAMADFDRAR